MIFFCKINLHKWSVREVHQTSSSISNINDRMYVETVIIEKCECGESRIVGREMLTCWVIPEHFIRKM